MTALSVLDLSPVSAGSSGAQALRNSLDLAKLADRLGYTRYWVAEHHNMPAIASSAPDIMIGQIAAVTSRIRVGSGGVMLPNHAPLTVAERFKVLEALFPDRIDLGLGRAPGTDQVTSYALRRRQGISEEDDFLDRFSELMALETRQFPEGHPFSKVHAMPAGQGEGAADVVAVLVRDEHGVQLTGRQPGSGQSRGELAQRKTAVDEYAAGGTAAARLDQRGVTAAAAAEAAEAKHGGRPRPT